MTDLEVAARRLVFDVALLAFYGKTSLTVQRPRPPMLELATSLMMAEPAAWNSKYKALIVFLGPWVVAVFDLQPPSVQPWSVDASRRAGAELVQLARGGRGRGGDGAIDAFGEERP